MNLIKSIPVQNKDGDYHVIVETPKGSRNKYSYDPKFNLFMLKKVLPAGASFPFDFGFVPGTKGEDGDPLDVIVIMDEQSFNGCLIETWMVGVIRATQKEKGKKAVRNDRLVAISAKAPNEVTVDCIEDLNPNLIKEIEHFFVSYNEVEGKKFSILDVKKAKFAKKLIKKFEL